MSYHFLSNELRVQKITFTSVMHTPLPRTTLSSIFHILNIQNDCICLRIR